MKIRRGPNPGTNFTILPNELLRDERLSLRARGFLALLLSFPEGWETSCETVTRHTPEGRDAVRSAMTELEAVGYAVRTRISDTRGRWRTVLEISGTARSAAATNGGLSTGVDSSDSKNCGKPGVGKPGVGKPGVSSKKDTKEDSSSNARARDTAGGGARVVGAAAADMASPRTNDDPDASSSAPPPDPVLTMAAPGLPSEASMDSSVAEVREGGSLAELAEYLSSQFGLGDWWPDGHKPVARFRVWLDAGWSIDDLVGMLLDRATTATKSRPGLIRTILDGHPLEPPRRPAPKASRWCGECKDGWVIDENGERGLTWCPCRSGKSTATDTTDTTETSRTIPGGRRLRSVSDATGPRWTSTWQPRTDVPTTRAAVGSA